MYIRVQLCFAVVKVHVYLFGHVQVIITLVYQKQSVVTRIILFCTKQGKMLTLPTFWLIN